MLKPLLLFEESAEFPNEVAGLISFVPTFEPIKPQEEEEILIDDRP